MPVQGLRGTEAGKSWFGFASSGSEPCCIHDILGYIKIRVFIFYIRFSFNVHIYILVLLLLLFLFMEAIFMVILYLHLAYLAVMLCSLGLLSESLIGRYTALHFTSKLEVKLCRVYLSSCFALSFSQMQTCYILAQMLAQSAKVCIDALRNGLEN